MQSLRKEKPPPEKIRGAKLLLEKAEADDEAEEVTKLEDLIELAADVKLAAITDAVKELPLEQMASFVNAWQTIDYSFKAPEAMAPAETKDPTYTFVPSSSFDYQTLEDTTLPKKYVMTYTEQRTKEAVEKALLALQVIDWNKLEKEINANGQKIDITKLKLEIAKAIKEVDWKKIDEETAAAMQAEQDQARFGTQLRNNMHDRAVHQEKVKLAQQQILLDRLAQHEKLKQVEEAAKAKTECQGATTTTTRAKKATVTAKKKKIVHI